MAALSPLPCAAASQALTRAFAVRPLLAGTMLSFFQQLWKRAGVAYRAEVGARLASQGLLYEDVLVETTDFKLALSRLPADVLNAREQRLKRALVLGSQQRYLPDEVAEKIDPWQPYLQPYIAEIEAANDEQMKLEK